MCRRALCGSKFISVDSVDSSSSPSTRARVSAMDFGRALGASLSAVKCTEIMCQHFGSLICGISETKRDLHFNAEGVANLFKQNTQESVKASRVVFKCCLMRA